MNDTDIIALYWARSETAITETDRKYGALCRSLAARILNNAADAEECVNDTYLTVWNSIPDARPTHFKAFICRLLKNNAFNMLRRANAQKRSGGYTESLDELKEFLSSASTPDTEIDTKELGRAISDFLRTQNDRHRNIFVRRFWFCESVGEIADDLDMTEATVSVSLYRTKQKLKNYLEKEGYVL
ncbi:MAG: sigma-70 family RNA polymerase sigma factor [Clostridia bacterium]|nr:sigma-70 family RNA polymerase sigma factor [Clostridia bacterium]